GAAPPTDAQTLALAEGVVGEPLVLADDASLGRLNRARHPRQIPREEGAKRPLADEADAGRVPLRVGRQPLLARNRTHLALAQMPDREERRGELALIEPMQKVGLVLRAIDSLHQLDLIPGCARLRVMPCRDPFGAKRQGMVEKRIELDLAVAEHVRVWRAAAFVFAQEVHEHPLAILAGEVHGPDVDA